MNTLNNRRNPVAKHLRQHRGGAHQKPRASERQAKRQQVQRAVQDWYVPRHTH